MHERSPNKEELLLERLRYLRKDRKEDWKEIVLFLNS